ncbi:type IVB secretion system protein IcmH/DotU, partial [Pseudomonas viridiflava]|uniref:type IVB secretion system protein IcmH/DotU n=1 Tax=Pseudomonas viridiflava TaxID=33069 RepID=UPI00197FFFB6
HHAIEHDQMLAARYVLCTVLDEAVLTTAWGSSSNWSTMSLLSHFHQETFGGEKFFQLLERLGSNPARHLHLLELMYLCLALGLKGKYRVTLRAND